MPEKRDLISIIIPVFNEEWSIYPLYGKLEEVMRGTDDEWEIIFVDDGSEDHTGDHLLELANNDDRIKVVQLRRNFGLTQALQAGFDHASGKFTVTLSGNLQNEPADIPSLLETLNSGYDVCAGWRSSLTGPLSRSRPGKILNWLISTISGVKLHDYECTLRAYRTEMLHGLQMYGHLERYIPVYIFWRGGKISEISVTQHPRSHGHGFSGSTTKRTFKTIFDLILLKFLERYSDRPLYIFGSMGLVSIVISFLAFCLMIYLKYGAGTAFISTPLPLVVVLFFLSGIILSVLGIMAEILSRLFFLISPRKIYDIKQLVGFRDERN